MDDMAYGESKVPLKEPTRGLFTLESENKYLREALRRFGKHEKDCDYFTPDRQAFTCSCGLLRSFTRFNNMDYD